MRTRFTRPLLALIGLACGAGAGAETSPYYIGASQGFSYNTNPARQPDAVAKGSWWSSTALVGGFDQQVGRQRFYGNGNVTANLYGQLDTLNNTSYGATAGWDWATIDRLSGTLYLSYSEGLADYGGFNQANLLEVAKVTQSSGMALATVQYGLLSLVAADLRLAHSTQHYNSDNRVADLSFSRYELNQTAIQGRVRKEFSGQLTAGVGVAYTQGDYFAISQTFDRYDLFATAEWHATGQSTLSGRLGYTWADYTSVIDRPPPFPPATQDSRQDGLTGWIAWQYVPTGALEFTTRLSYDTLANSVFTNGGNSTGTTDKLTAGLQFNAKYVFSAKTSFNASLEYYSRSQSDERNRFTNAMLGATWLPTRSTQVNCNLTLNDRNQRQSSGQLVLLTPYTAYGGSCSVQLTLQ